MKTWIGGVTICADIEDLDVDANELHSMLRTREYVQESEDLLINGVVALTITTDELNTQLDVLARIEEARAHLIVCLTQSIRRQI
jgi:hypothetical protein